MRKFRKSNREYHEKTVDGCRLIAWLTQLDSFKNPQNPCKTVSNTFDFLFTPGMLSKLISVLCSRQHTTAKMKWYLFCKDKDPMFTEYAHWKGNVKLVFHLPCLEAWVKDWFRSFVKQLSSVRISRWPSPRGEMVGAPENKGASGRGRGEKGESMCLTVWRQSMLTSQQLRCTDWLCMSAIPSSQSEEWVGYSPNPTSFAARNLRDFG